ncbi:hypothetical protein GCM10010112_12260 [Actinoplanes lobatus]|uniref:Lipoprotein n=1 Tax=Actinoplanes lobatus TaxID=113568 RepID=A0A7W7HDT8_9ACTN|nr:hypothetical protein [Actinoplanes lobatus]MBB4748689.1 hypothetical protein [Actinoplanes lobatus]GGN58466.1 hypothetical protein GCM10010112_12260 [Actinoplanes lobatus]GIE37409.1 hypothetical protein Alo02nite_03070 [Actinoplanes lobatus]
MSTARINVVIAIGALTVLFGCAAPATESEDGHVLTVQEAIDVGAGQVRVRGYVLITRDKVTQLCTGLAGSYPPQCGTPALVVQGLAVDLIPHRESAQGVVWGGEITVQGSLSAGVLNVT